MNQDTETGEADPVGLDQQPGATVTFYTDGPMLLRGDFALRTPAGEIIDARRETVALCRCGRSAIKPFCDGSHKQTGFRAPERPESRPG